MLFSTLQAIKFPQVLDAAVLSAYGGLLATTGSASGAQPALLVPLRLEGLPCRRLLQLLTAASGPRGAKHAPVPILLLLQAADTSEPTKVRSAVEHCCHG